MTNLCKFFEILGMWMVNCPMAMCSFRIIWTPFYSE